jgi:hypothetical protein
MSDKSLNKVLLIMSCDCSGGDRGAHCLWSAASTLLNEEGAFDDDLAKA